MEVNQAIEQDRLDDFLGVLRQMGGP
jgi:hypothetical protein